MPKFLIEVPHSEDMIDCARVVKMFLTSGSHYLSNAEWGCEDGVHKSWMIVEVDSKEEAERILPPGYRAQATIVQLNRFSVDAMDRILKHHKSC